MNDTIVNISMTDSEKAMIAAGSVASQLDTSNPIMNQK